jgi:excinuclease UvrABC helicase subunit UvrB
MESMDSFLNDLDIFEITETYLDSPERNIIYHRKFETKEILNGNKSILGDYQTKQIKDGNDLVNNIVRDLDTNIVMLKQTLDVLIKNEEFEKAIEIREKIKKIESNNIK